LRMVTEFVSRSRRRVRISISPLAQHLPPTSQNGASLFTPQPDEYFTGLMERVVDGPQQASWASGISEAMNVRGREVEVIVQPTRSICASFFLSSRGYAVFVKGTWPGLFDFAVSRPDRAGVEFEGPSFEMKMYTGDRSADLVRAHAMD